MNEIPAETLPLFRAQAVEDVTSRYGAPTKPVGVGSWILACFLLVTLVLVTVFLTSTRFARKETVQGVLLPPAGAIKLTSLKAGVVTEVLVKDGQDVAANSPLVRISVDATVDGGRPIGALLSEANEAQSRALLSQIAANHEAVRQVQEDVAVRRSGLSRQISDIQRQLAVERDRINLARAAQEAARPLAEKQIVSGQEFRQRQDALLTAQQNASRFLRDLTQAEQALAETGVEMRRVTAEAAEESARLEGQRAELLGRKAQALAQEDITIVSERPGRIAALQVKPGQLVPVGSTIGVLLPHASVLQAHLWIPSKAAGFVRVGDEVKLMYDAFPYQRFGLGAGRVISISDAPISNSELPLQRAGVPPNENLYEVKVAIDRQYVEAYGKRWPLLAGMQTMADLVLEKRSLLTWLLDPLRAAGARHAGA